MFEAIRSKLVGAWKALREKGLVALFFFELVVVTLGVLLAQIIADWANEQAAYAEMEEERKVAFQNLSEAMTYVHGWKVVIPCIDARMTDVMRKSSLGEQVPPRDLRLPGFYGSQFDFLPERSARLLEQRYGTTEGSELVRAAASSLRMREILDHIILNWEALGQIDATLGTPSELDRQQARKAASSIKTSLHRMNIVGNNILDAGRILGIKADPTPAKAGRPLANCEEFWRLGRSHGEPTYRNPNVARL